MLDLWGDLRARECLAAAGPLYACSRSFASLVFLLEPCKVASVKYQGGLEILDFGRIVEMNYECGYQRANDAHDPMASGDEADKAMSKLNGSELEGRAISVTVAREKENRDKRRF